MYLWPQAVHDSAVAASEQERRAKAAEARAEAERVLAQQAAELERKKADMDKREAEREAVRVAQVPIWALIALQCHAAEDLPCK